MRDSFAADETATATQVPADQIPPELSPEKMMQDMLLLVGMIFFIFYFILFRPQQRRLKAHRTLMKGLQKGNKVITGGGIIGTIVKFEGDDVAVVEISPNVRVRVARSSISDVVSDKAAQGEIANDN